MSAMRHLVAALRNPASTATLRGDQWSALISVARGEMLLATLGHRLAGAALPSRVAALFAAECAYARQMQRHALWEVEMARRALTPIGVSVILLKGSAYAAAGLSAAAGRHIGDLDILVPRDRLADVETALIDAGWEWVKNDPYDQAYYRQWMHELPPLIHGARDRMIDVHHNLLPLTARHHIDAAALVDRAQPVADGVLTLDPIDRLIHCAAHMLADGDLAGGLRNLWDFHCLTGDAAALDGAWQAQLLARAQGFGLTHSVRRALRLSAALYGDGAVLRLTDRLFIRRLLARDATGKPSHPLTQLGFYIRSHGLRMPPAMLARHLWRKWRMARTKI